MSAVDLSAVKPGDRVRIVLAEPLKGEVEGVVSGGNTERIFLADAGWPEAISIPTAAIASIEVITPPTQGLPVVGDCVKFSTALQAVSPPGTIIADEFGHPMILECDGTWRDTALGKGRAWQELVMSNLHFRFLRVGWEWTPPPAPEVWLTADDPEPAVGSVVLDACDDAWQRQDNGEWDSATDGPEDWSHVASFGPVRLLHSGAVSE